MINNDNQLLTAREVADYFRVSLMTVNRWTKSGILECIRIAGTKRRLYTKEHIENLVRNYERG